MREGILIQRPQSGAHVHTHTQVVKQVEGKEDDLKRRRLITIPLTLRG